MTDWSESNRQASNRPLLALLALSGVGVAIAGYLTYVHFDESALVCTVGGCETVQQSTYSTLFGVPIAALGLLMFLTVAFLSWARLSQRLSIPRDIATIASWTLLFTSLLYYAYLTYIEIWVLEAICQWCVLSSLVALVMFALESRLLLALLNDPGDEAP